MREHKYRAWIIKEKRYMEIIGFHVYDKHITLWFVDDEDGPTNYKNYHIDAVILEQYTGRKDFSGYKEVYEGDRVNIIRDGRETENLVVEWSDEKCGFRFVNEDWNIMTGYIEHIEIIGNIHKEQPNAK